MIFLALRGELKRLPPLRSYIKDEIRRSSVTGSKTPVWFRPVREKVGSQCRSRSDATRKLMSGKHLATTPMSLHSLSHGYRMIHYRIIQIALLVEGNAFRLYVALLIGRAHGR
jgi:hypothetical protein